MGRNFMNCMGVLEQMSFILVVYIPLPTHTHTHTQTHHLPTLTRNKLVSACNTKEGRDFFKCLF